MITKEIIENPLFIMEKNKSIKFDIESTLYKQLKLRTGLELSKNFMSMELRAQKTLFGIIATFYVPVGTKTIKIKILGNEHDTPVTNTHESNNAKFISVNTFLPVPDGIDNNQVLEIAKTFIMENSPFAMTILSEQNIVMEDNANLKQTTIEDAITHYTEFSDSSFIVSCYKTLLLKDIINSENINSIKNEETVKLLSSLESQKQTDHIQVPLGIYSIITGEINASNDNVSLLEALDNKFPCFTEEGFKERNIMIFDKANICLSVNDNSTLYLFENLDKIIYLASKELTEDINDDIAKFLNEL